MWRLTVFGQHEWWAVSLLTLTMPVMSWCFGWDAHQWRSGNIFSESLSIFRRKYFAVPLASEFSNELRIGLIIPICFIWALQGLIKHFCISFERLVWKAVQNCNMLMLPLIHIIVPWCAEFNHLGGFIGLKENTGVCQMAKQHPSVMSSTPGLCGLQNTIL